MTPAPIDAPKQLVVNGLYRYVRNPMYVDPAFSSYLQNGPMECSYKGTCLWYQHNQPVSGSNKWGVE